MSKTYKIVNKKGKKAKSIKHAQKKGIKCDYICRCDYCKNKEERENLKILEKFKDQIKDYNMNNHEEVMTTAKKVFTRGTIIVNELQIGDVMYELEYDDYIKTTVQTLPVRNDEGLWEWKSITDDGAIINYAVHENYSHYAPKLYYNLND